MWCLASVTSETPFTGDANVFLVGILSLLCVTAVVLKGGQVGPHYSVIHGLFLPLAIPDIVS